MAAPRGRRPRLRYRVASSPATETSSSRSGQWRPTPPPISRQLRRCSALAARSAGNHSSGALTSRPSASRTRRASSVNDASTARGSTGILAAEELIPFLLEQRPVLVHQATQLRQLPAAEPTAAGERHGHEPELRVRLRPLDVNVSRLPALVAEEEEPVARGAEDGRHPPIYAARGPAVNRSLWPSNAHWTAHSALLPQD